MAGKGSKKEKRRGEAQGKSRAGRKNTTLGNAFGGLGKGGGSHPGSVRLGGDGGGGDDVAKAGGAGGFAEMDKNAKREREENLDKAQVTLRRWVKDSDVSLQILSKRVERDSCSLVWQ